MGEVVIDPTKSGFDAMVPAAAVAAVKRKKRAPVSDIQAKNFSIEETDEQKLEREKKEAERKGDDPVYILGQYRKEADDARKPHKSNWDKNWDLYNNTYDFSKKAPWQSQNYVAIVPVLVRGIKYLMKRALTTAGDFFDIQLNSFPEGEQRTTLEGYAKAIIQKQFKENKFPVVISEAAAASLLESLLIVKVLPNGNSGNTITAESAYNIRIDPSGRNRWLIHSISRDLDQVMARAKEGVYDIKEVEKCKAEFIRQQEKQDEARRKDQGIPATVNLSFRKEVVLDEFYGDLMSQNGELIMKDCFFTVMNEEYLLRKPTPISSVLKHGQRPIVIGAPNPKPFSVYHQAVVSDVNGMANMATEVLNLTLDTNLMSMARAFELDVSQVADPQDLIDGIYPGKVYKKNPQPGKPDKQMISEINIGNVPQQDLLIYEGMKNQIQNDMGFWNEFAMGSISKTAGSRATAREVSERSTQSSASMQSVAEEIEAQVIIPVLEQMWSNTLQYFRDYKKLKGILPDDLLSMVSIAPNGLESIFGPAAEFEAKGMSGVLNRLEELGKIERFAGMVRMFPGIERMLKVKDILRQVVVDFGWNPKKFTLTDEELKIQAQQDAIAAQQAAMKQSGGPWGAMGGMR